MSDTRFGEGPYHLTVRSLACNIGRNDPGPCLLGEKTEDGFVAAYSGPSDTDVNARLQGRIGKYRHILFADTATRGTPPIMQEYIPLSGASGQPESC